MAIETRFIIKNREGVPTGGLSIAIIRGQEGRLAAQLLDQWPGCREVRWENPEAFGQISWGEGQSETDIAEAERQFDERSRLA